MISAVSVAELPKVAELIRTAVLQSIDATDLPMPDPMLNRTGRPGLRLGPHRRGAG